MKKRHFYHNRIQLLALALVVLVAGLFVIGASHSTIKAKDMGGAAVICFVPFAIIKTLKEKGTFDNLDEDTKTYLTSLEDQINNVVKENTKGMITVKEMETELAKIGKGLNEEQMKSFTDMLQTVKDSAAEIQKLKDAGINAKLGGNTLVKAMTDRAEELKSFKGAKAGKLTFEIATKTGGADQAPTDIADHTIGLRVPGIGQIPVRKPFMSDLFPTVNCSLEFIRYIDQESVVRNAQNVATAAASTHTTKLTWKERNIQITNIRDMVDVPINMLDDYDFVQGEVERLLNTNVALKKDDGLLNGTGINPELHSVLEVASEFDATNTIGGTIDAWTGSVANPNIFDLAIAMCSQIVALGADGSYLPNTILVNTIDKYKSMLIKDEEGRYILPPFVAVVNNKEYTIDGMQVRSNPNVAANTMVVMDSSKGTIYQRKGAVLEMSYENAANFETEIVTLKVYERLNLLIRNVDKNAFMKCSDITTALASIKA